MNTLVIKDVAQYHRICEKHISNITEWSKYLDNKIDSSIDVIAENLQKNYYGIYFMLNVYEILLYKLLGNKDLNYFDYKRLVDEYNINMTNAKSTDDMYDITIKTLIKSKI